MSEAAANLGRALTREEKHYTQRKKWTETFEEDGQAVEYLMVECESTSCHMPRPHSIKYQRVVRLADKEMKDWEFAETQHCSNSVAGWLMAVMVISFLTLFILGLTAKSACPGIIYFITGITPFVCLLGLFANINKRIKSREQALRKIIDKHREIPANTEVREVGMSFTNKYLICSQTQYKK